MGDVRRHEQRDHVQRRGQLIPRMTAVRVGLDHAGIFASDPSSTVRFFQTRFGAIVVWDDVVASVRVVRLQIGRAFIEATESSARWRISDHDVFESRSLTNLIPKGETA
jgi:hypothetical protein